MSTTNAPIGSPAHPTATRYRAAGAQVVVIDDAGHSVNLQRPTEVAELISDFTGQPSPADARQPVLPVSQRFTHGASRDST